MRFYRKEVKGANGQTIHRDMYENPTGGFVGDGEFRKPAMDMGEVDGQMIGHYRNEWNAYIQELKNAHQVLPDMKKYFIPGTLQVDWTPDSTEDRLPRKVEEPRQPDFAAKDEASGNFVTIPEASPDHEKNVEEEKDHPHSADPHVHA